MVYKRQDNVCFLSLGVQREPTITKLCVDNMVCRLGVDLQSPADMFHFPLFSLCLSFILRVCRDIARATWVDDWWCPLVNIVPYMCRRPKEPMSWTSFPNFSFFLFVLPPPLLFYFPHSSRLFLLPFTNQPPPHPPPSNPLHPLYLFFLPLPSSPSILLMVVFHSYGSAVERGMRPFLLLL